MTLERIAQDDLLRAVTHLEQLLHNIVAEKIVHQRQSLGHDLVEDHIALLDGRLFECGLDEPSAVLVAAEFGNVVAQMLTHSARNFESASLTHVELPVPVAIGSEIAEKSTSRNMMMKWDSLYL